MQNYNSKYKSDLKTRCYTFSLAVIALMDTLPNKRAAWVIADQLLRAASSRLEYKKFYEISLKSANETKYWLGLLRDSGLSNTEATNTLLREVTEIANMLATGVMKLKMKNF